MPVNRKMLNNMIRHYGSVRKGKQVYYAMENQGKVKAPKKRKGK